MDAIRLPRANKVLETSLEAGEVYEYRGPAGDDLDALGKHLPNRMDWIWYHDHDEDIKKAELWLKENGATKA